MTEERIHQIKEEMIFSIKHNKKTKAEWNRYSEQTCRTTTVSA